MSKDDFDRAVETGRPYFGPYMMCRRSWPHIYWYQQKLMRLLSGEPRSEPFDILEIGAWAGASRVSWGHALRENFTGAGRIASVDPWKSDEHPDIKAAFLHNIAASGLVDLVEPFEGTGEEAFETYADRRFDIVYVDGDHSYPFVRIDIDGALRLLKPGGVICGDDLEVQLHELDGAQVRASTARGEDWAADPRSGNGYHPGVTLAVGETFGPVSAWHGFWAVRSSAEGFRPLSLDDVQASLPDALMQYDNEGRRVG